MKQKGFTLLELLLALFAISVLIVVTHFNVTSLHVKQRVEQFLKQFSYDILYMQQLASKRQKQYTLRCSKRKQMYYISEPDTDFLIVKRVYNKDIQFYLHTFPYPMTY
ncbi:prepilin-type N-terminal cleavage/methylation domain-containing protein, partial [Bacillus nitratireducens]|uniref:prepilin-type N-terminal cleavage/methylation domain-containing protein n=1 Tax=Bacillus nitratireducens TaxID=2026193 RepID=UPI002846CC85